MYAKLSFPAGTQANEVCRDVTKLVINSNGAGAASTAILEFADANSSVVVDQVASGWSLIPEETLNTGAADGTDAMYTLESPHAAGGKKYMNVKVSGDPTNSTVYSSTDNGIIITPIIDYGTATQARTAGYAGTSVGTAAAAGAVVSTLFHVFCTEKMFILVGATASPQTYTGGCTWVHMILEGAPTDINLAYNMNPVMYVRNAIDTTGTGLDVSYGANDFRIETTSTSNTWYNAYYVIQLNDAEYDDAASRRFRQILLLPNSVLTGFGLSSNYTIDDGTTSGSAVTSFSILTPISSIDKITYTHDSMYSSIYRNSAKSVDSNGNPVLRMSPLYWQSQHNHPEVLDFSVCPVYRTYGSQGNTGDIITINGDEYFYLNGMSYPNTVVSGAFIRMT